MFTSKGKLKYYGIDKVVLLIDLDIVNYYYKLIPLYLPKQRQKWFGKITVVRTGVERPNHKFWRKYENEIVEFNYGTLYEDNDYYLLPAYSTRLCNIRMEMGLPAYRKPYRNFHITIANKKHVKDNE